MGYLGSSHTRKPLFIKVTTSRQKIHSDIFDCLMGRSCYLTDPEEYTITWKLWVTCMRETFPVHKLAFPVSHLAFCVYCVAFV